MSIIAVMYNEVYYDEAPVLPANVRDSAEVLSVITAYMTSSTEYYY